MICLEDLTAEIEHVAGHSKRLLDNCDGLLAEQTDCLTKLRREHTHARRAVGSLSNGSEAMRAIGQTIGEQIEPLAEAAETKADEVALIRTRRRRIAKAVDLLLTAVNEQQAPNAALVRPIVARLIDEKDGLTYEEVYGLVRDKLAADQLPLIGLGLQVKRALVDLPLETDDDGVYHAKSDEEAAAAGGSPESPATIFRPSRNDKASPFSRKRQGDD